MKLNFKTSILLAATMVAGMAHAGNLGVGSMAPPLKVAKWVKGTF